MVEKFITDPLNYATLFGYSGTYWDYVREIAKERGSLSGLINLSVSEAYVYTILQETGFKGYRLDGASQWIAKTMSMVSDLS